MKFGMVGLGRMGTALARNAMDHGHEVVGYDIDATARSEFGKAGGEVASSYDDLLEQLEQKIVWVMLPHGDPTADAIDDLSGKMMEGIIINGANEHYDVSTELAELCEGREVSLLDVGVSGGMKGAREGACMMIGGDEETFEQIEELFEDLCTDNGYAYVGPAGAGHYVKMVHNAIEYGMMEAIGEGFDLLEAADYDLDLEEVSRVYAHGSVIRGWLMQLLWKAQQQGLERYPAEIGQSGTGLWSLHEALDRQVNMPAVQAAVQRRNRTKHEYETGSRVIQAMRHEFGGHDAEDEI